MKKNTLAFLFLGVLCIASDDESVSSNPQFGESSWDDADFDHRDQESHGAGVVDEKYSDYSYKTQECSNNDEFGFCFESYGWNILNYLSPHITQPNTLADIREKLRNGKVVVLRDAFIPEFAETMHQDLLQLNYTLQERYDPDGFHVKQHNVYLFSDFTQTMLAADKMFNSQETKQLIHDLTGRDCTGIVRTTASWFAPGGYVLPHSDHRDERTVSFVWHLSKNWLPEWGGALYWNTEVNEHAFVHASFNTLSLFSVTDKTIHMVTPVSPHATEKRLTWNGWYTSAWLPSANDDLLSYLDTTQKREHLTENQVKLLHELVDGGSLDNDLTERVRYLLNQANKECFRPATTIHNVF